ncbi:hypothetical protein M409DRAFT_19948 [Zasmidium cellare ATCC 36951]|uniref:Aquaporin-like protein n=1 Tax=Zasmidium cellare ATCC 36951 TaxID=1080233 RepID=A0A6A6CR24_ZASCE|nr:uncharacterized protein M409DRAFT_19948 [Zasmidium cellare ATCC 36951]KAF2169535.1 hypothetical protein M409DRAFT_19948 [Zasmidium cellare ATCC 36951]
MSGGQPPQSKSNRPAAGGRSATARTAGTATSVGDGYSLAGPSPIQAEERIRSQGYDPHNTYYQEGYRAANPWMGNEKPGSSFSLAGTFPHHIRWGKRKPKEGEPRLTEASEPMGTEPAPQVPEANRQATRQNTEEEEATHPPQHGGDDRVDSEASTEVGGGGDSSNADSSVQHRRIDAYRSGGQRLGSIAEEDFVEPLDPDDRPFNYWAKIRLHLQRPLAEWLGTTIFMFVGSCGNLSVITSNYQTGSMQSMYWCWGFAVMLAIYIAGGGSGAFLNPALTIMLSVFRGFPARRVPIYIIAQLLGAFTGTLLAFAIYRDNIIHLDGGLIPNSTGAALYTQPKDWVSNSTAFFTEMLGTAVIGCSIMALGDSHNSPPGAGMHAFIIGLLTTTVTMALGFSTGGCFNPVRDLGPRLASIAVGYPTSSFTSHQNWWIWGPCCATITGALLGGLIYDLCIFKGGESPVNYSFNRWKIEGLKEERDVSNFFGLKKRAAEIDRRLESGELSDEKSSNKDV